VVLWGVLILGLSSTQAVGQPSWRDAERPPQALSLQLTVGLDFFARMPPELHAQASLLRGPFTLSVDVSQSLWVQSPSWRLGFDERISLPPLSLGVGLSWSGDSGSSAKLDLLWAEPSRKFTTQVSDRGISGLFDGALKGSGFALQADKLRWSDDRLTAKRATLRWRPLSWVVIEMRVGPEGPKPPKVTLQQSLTQGSSLTVSGQLAAFDQGGLSGLTVGLTQALGSDVDLSISSRFSVEGGLELNGVGLTLRRGLLSGGLALAPSGDWEEVWLRGARSIANARLKGEIHVGPEGWRSVQLEGEAADPTRGSLKGKVLLKPSSWTLHTEGRLLAGAMSTVHGVLDLESDKWDLQLGAQLMGGFGSSLQGVLKLSGQREWALQLQGQLLTFSGSLQGSLGLDPGGLSSLALMGDLFLGEATIQGQLTYGGGLWLLDLTGGLPLGKWWELSGALSLSTLSGWESGSVGITRLIQF